ARLQKLEIQGESLMLPIGSIVYLKEGASKLMILNRSSNLSPEEMVGRDEEISRQSGRMYNSSNFTTGSDLLSVGTVVNIDFVKQAVMIYGRKQQQADKQKIWDYVACPYPQGHLSGETNVFFNHEHINDVM